MKFIWLFLLVLLLGGSGVIAIVQTQESAPGESTSGPGLIANVRDIAGDDVGDAVDEVGEFLSEVPARLGLRGDDDFGDGSFVPAAARARNRTALEPGALFELLDLTVEQYARNNGTFDDGRISICHEWADDYAETIKVQPESVLSHVERGDELGECEDDDDGEDDEPDADDDALDEDGDAEGGDDDDDDEEDD